MTSTNYLTIAGSALPALEQTIEQKYKEGVSYIVTIEIQRLASGIWVTVSRLENPPNSLFLDTMDFLTMGVVAIVLLRLHQESMEEAAALCRHRLCICQDRWMKFWWWTHHIKFLIRKVANIHQFLGLNCKQLTCCNLLRWVSNSQISGALKIGGGQKQARRSF